jgi:hypothetical protein
MSHFTPSQPVTAAGPRPGDSDGLANQYHSSSTSHRARCANMYPILPTSDEFGLVAESAVTQARGP